MSTGWTSDAVRRSSDIAEGAEQEVRRALLDSLNERRLRRERIIASLLLCPGGGAREEQGPRL
jgi:hypothetical protein